MDELISRMPTEKRNLGRSHSCSPEAECPNHEAYSSLAFRICGADEPNLKPLTGRVEAFRLVSGHDALPGEQCYSQVRYAMESDLRANPDRPGLEILAVLSLRLVSHNLVK